MQRPKTLLASGAGAAAANGLYKEEGLYKGVPKYVHENGQLWVLRYRLRSGRYWWYIADKDQLDVDDGDLYRIQSAAELPPLFCPWSKARDGILPGPVLTEVAADGSALELEAGVAARSVRDYNAMDAIASVLRSGDVAFVRASYLLELSASNKILPRRQDLPAHAMVSAPMLERLLDELDMVTRCQRQHEMLFPGCVIVSYAWGDKGHPDKHGEMLSQVLAPAIEWYLSERAAFVANDGCRGTRSVASAWWRDARAHAADGHDFGLFLDYGSLHQHERSATETAAFRRALNSMDVFYSHKATVVWRLTRSLSGQMNATSLPYDARGWPYFETCIAGLVKPRLMVLDLGRADWMQPLGLYKWDNDAAEFVQAGQEPIAFTGVMKPAGELARQASYTSCFNLGVLGAVLDQRPPPVVPSVFEKDVHKQTFTNNSDVKAVIALQRRVSLTVLSAAKWLQFDTMGWGVDQVDGIIAAVHLAPRLETLNLEYNTLRDEGAIALAEHLKKGLPIQKLSLSNNKIGDAGLAAIFDACAGRALPNLRQLSCMNNEVGERARASLKRLTQARPSVEVKCISV